jgi:hypothetical protein
MDRTDNAENIANVLEAIGNLTSINAPLSMKILQDVKDWIEQHQHLKDLSPEDQEKEFNKWATEWQTKEFGKPINELLKEVS